ncbi:hypothetical protein HQ520_18780 [bacterium]|nr:hypothetical protein [bacterium]
MAREVRNYHGAVLVNKGVVLDAEIIGQLVERNVRKVVVKGSPVSLGHGPTPDLHLKLREMEKAFTHLRGDVEMEKFRVLVKNHLIRRDREMRGEIPDEEDPRDGEIS